MVSPFADVSILGSEVIVVLEFRSPVSGDILCPNVPLPYICTAVALGSRSVCTTIIAGIYFPLLFHICRPFPHPITTYIPTCELTFFISSFFLFVFPPAK